MSIYSCTGKKVETGLLRKKDLAESIDRVDNLNNPVVNLNHQDA
jgi:hypothetical protein